MIQNISIIFLFTLLSCRNNNQIPTKPSTDTTIELIDNLGTLHLNIPYKSDTFLNWIRRNDCGKSCEEGKYRFQNKNFPIFKESGFFWIGQPEDSVYQLTISHHRPDTLVRNNDSFAIKHYSYFKEGLEFDPETTNILSDTIQKINDRYYCILKIADIDKKKGVLIRRLVAFTSISGNALRFRYDLLTRHRDSILYKFFDDSMKNLETVRIKDGF